MAHYPNKVAILRAERGLTQAELAELAGITAGTIHRLEIGRSKNPRIRSLVLLARALGVPLIDLFEDEEIA